MARDMMGEADVPHTFLGEGKQATIYLANRTQLGPNSDQTPYELWKGRPASVNDPKWILDRLSSLKCSSKRKMKVQGCSWK